MFTSTKYWNDVLHKTNQKENSHNNAHKLLIGLMLISNGNFFHTQIDISENICECGMFHLQSLKEDNLYLGNSEWEEPIPYVNVFMLYRQLWVMSLWWWKMALYEMMGNSVVIKVLKSFKFQPYDGILMSGNYDQQDGLENWNGNRKKVWYSCVVLFGSRRRYLIKMDIFMWYFFQWAHSPLIIKTVYTWN